MVMIPLWKEREIREKIAKDPTISNRVLAELLNISKDAIKRVRQSPKLRPRKPPRPHRTLTVKRRCPECGGLLEIWPCPLCRPWAYYYDDVTLEDDFNAEEKAA